MVCLKDDVQLTGTGTLGVQGLVGAQFELRWKAEGSKLWNVVVVLAAPGTRAGFPAGNKGNLGQLWAVVAPNLTALGRSLRKQHPTLFAWLSQPRWRKMVGHDVAGVAVAVEV